MINILELRKLYGGHTVIDHINLSLEAGQTYALLGKNGAGKTTMIHLILDLIKVSSGSIQIRGKDHKQLSAEDKTHIGVVGEDLALLEELNAEEYLKFVARIYRIPADTIGKRIEDLFSYFFEAEDDIRKSISKYSTGMKKKIAFCAAVMHTPDILILDEPFSGLDPLVANQMLHFLSKYQNGKRLIFVSSHDLSYIEKISTHIGVLSEGNLVFNSSLRDFTENGKRALDSALFELLNPNNKELSNIDWL